MQVMLSLNEEDIIVISRKEFEDSITKRFQHRDNNINFLFNYLNFLHAIIIVMSLFSYSNYLEDEIFLRVKVDYPCPAEAPSDLNPSMPSTTPTLLIADMDTTRNNDGCRCSKDIFWTVEWETLTLGEWEFYRQMAVFTLGFTLVSILKWVCMKKNKTLRLW